jgi:Cysteine-rich secretory protein family
MIIRLAMFSLSMISLSVLISSAGLARSARSGSEGAILEIHNAARAEVGVAPLKWDRSLAARARVWAARIARTGAFEHENQARDGENIWMGGAGDYRLPEMLANWVDEKAQFKAGVYPDVSTTGRANDVGHYTQMIWPKTTHVGCGRARGSDMDVLVCRYGPAGNITNSRVVLGQKEHR